MKRYLTILSCAFIFILSCSRDQLPPEGDCSAIQPTYNTTVRPIIEATCAQTLECHTSGNFSDLTSYESYQTMIPDLTEALFESQVISESMPPSYATESPTSLTQDQYETLRCWIENGYPE